MMFRFFLGFIASYLKMSYALLTHFSSSSLLLGGAELDEYTELGKEIVQRFPLHMYSKLHDISHTWVTFWKQHHHSEITAPWSPFRVSYYDTYRRVRNDVGYFMANLLTQPLDSIAEYFGESIAFYFAYMAFYTRWLVFPSVLGIIVFAVQVSEYNWSFLMFLLTIFLEYFYSIFICKDDYDVRKVTVYFSSLVYCFFSLSLLS